MRLASTPSMARMPTLSTAEALSQPLPLFEGTVRLLSNLQAGRNQVKHGSLAHVHKCTCSVLVPCNMGLCVNCLRDDALPPDVGGLTSGLEVMSRAIDRKRMWHDGTSAHLRDCHLHCGSSSNSLTYISHLSSKSSPNLRLIEAKAQHPARPQPNFWRAHLCVACGEQEMCRECPVRLVLQGLCAIVGNSSGGRSLNTSSQGGERCI